MSIKKAKIVRLLLTILFCLTGFVFPILIVCDKINLVTEVNAKKISIIGVILLLSIAYSCRKSIIDHINSLEYSYFKSIFLGLTKVSFLIIVLSVEIAISVIIKTASQDTLQQLLAALDNVRYCIRWWCILSIIAHLGIKPFIDKCTHIVKKELRKDELREVLKE